MGLVLYMTVYLNATLTAFVHGVHLGLLEDTHSHTPHFSAIHRLATGQPRSTFRQAAREALSDPRTFVKGPDYKEKVRVGCVCVCVCVCVCAYV